MLNYIWAGLIIVSLVFALASDVGDIVGDTYRNADPLPVRIEFERPFDAEAPRQAARLVVDPIAFRQFYGVTDGAPEAAGDPLAAKRPTTGRRPPSALPGAWDFILTFSNC